MATLVKSWGTSLLDAILPKRKTLARLRARWGAEGDKNEFLASRYFDLTHHASPASRVDDKTWRDLEFPEIFARMDTTVTPVGSQILFALLREYVDASDTPGQRYATYTELSSNASLRESIQLRLARLEDDSNAGLAELLFGERVDEPAHLALLLSWSLATLALLVLVAAMGWSAWIWLPMLPVNAVILFRAATRQHRELEAMKRCIGLLDVADKLAALHTKHPVQPHLAGLHTEATQRTAVRKGLFWLSVMRWASNPELLFLPILVGILNFVFLMELVIHAGTIERFFRIRSRLWTTFRLVGEIDAAIAMASFLHRNPHHCLPTLSDEPTLAIVDGRHPLLADGVPNSIRLDRRSILVTGSNMAGKTTFIKTLAANAILAQTAGFCLASAAIIPRSTVMASIHGAHSIASGKSHYFAEIEAVDGFIRNGAPGRMRILAIDEPFSGTNTVERLAVARAVLEALASQAIVLVTTHDVELQALLGDRYVLCHFQENPEADGYFDYTLKTGAATERNAIRLLDRLGFPKTITTNAMRYARQNLAAGTTEQVVDSQPVQS
jgi:energy-coupling factor transporter ATP-binding protein EcfA2